MTDLFRNLPTFAEYYSEQPIRITINSDCKLSKRDEAWEHLLADLVQFLPVAVGEAELHVNGVVEQSQAATGLQDPVGLLEEAGPVKPVEGRHGCHQVH